MTECKGCEEEFEENELNEDGLCDECKKKYLDELASAIIWEPSIFPNPEDFT